MIRNGNTRSKFRLRFLKAAFGKHVSKMNRFGQLGGHCSSKTKIKVQEHEIKKTIFTGNPL